MTVLTPYLGQLQKLRKALAADNDPVLNDLDTHDLVRAGLMPAAGANVVKRRIRLATIGIFMADMNYSAINHISQTIIKGKKATSSSCH